MAQAVDIFHLKIWKTGGYDWSLEGHVFWVLLRVLRLYYSKYSFLTALLFEAEGKADLRESFMTVNITKCPEKTSKNEYNALSEPSSRQCIVLQTNIFTK